MFSFFSRKPKEKVPEWAAFLTADEYRQFIGQVDAYFKAIHVTYVLNDGVLEVDESFGFEKLGLVNLAQLWKQEEPEYRPTVVPDHFDRMVRSKRFDEEFSKRVGEYAFIEPYLGVRVYGEDYLEAVGAQNVVHRQLAEGLVVVLVFDQPDTVSSIKPEQAALWGRGAEELFQTGQENIRQNYRVEVSEQEVGGFNLWLIGADHVFATNILLDLAGQSELLGSFGALVGVPHRHSVLAYPIENLGVVNALNTLIPTVSGMYEEGPGSISPNLYWYWEGKYVNLPYAIEEGKLQFFPPEEFLSVLNELQD